MINYARNTEDLKLAIREHTIAGYPLMVPSPFVRATGISTVTIPSLTSVITELNTPMPFALLAATRNWDPIAYGYSYWVKYTKQKHLPSSEENPLKWLHPNSQAFLEKGYTLSERDIQSTWLHELGHLDRQGNIRKFSFPLSSVTIRPEDLQPGMLVEFKDNPVSGSAVGTFPGRVLGVEADTKDGTPVVLLESFEPVPALLAPKAIAPWMIEPSYVPNKTWALGYGTYHAMKKKRIKIPSGMFDPKDLKNRVYFLDQPMPLEKVQNFCKKHFPKNPECVWQSMVFLVLPIHVHEDEKGRHRGGFFRPYPDDMQTTEIEAQIDFFTEGMEFEE